MPSGAARDSTKEVVTMLSSGSERRTLDPTGSSECEGLSGREGLGREAVLIVSAMLLYFGIRNLTAGSTDAAFGNADLLSPSSDGSGSTGNRGCRARGSGATPS